MQKWIPAMHEQWLVVKTNSKPHLQLLCKRSSEVYEASKQALTPHIIRAQDFVYPYFQVYISQPSVYLLICFVSQFSSYFFSSLLFHILSPRFWCELESKSGQQTICWSRCYRDKTSCWQSPSSIKSIHKGVGACLWKLYAICDYTSSKGTKLKLVIFHGCNSGYFVNTSLFTMIWLEVVFVWTILMI